jgi:alpha-L-fucosidase 2
MSGLVLRYTAPASAWTDALPLGNGRLGAMCFGGPLRDRIQVNDDTCWSGSPATNAGLPRIAPGEGPQVVQDARDALERGDVREAERLVQRLQHGHSQAYQPLVDLWVEQLPATPADGHEPTGALPPGAVPYERSLDLRTGVARHAWTSGGVHTTQEVFVSAPAGVLVLHRVVDVRDPVDLVVSVTSPHPLADVRTSTSSTGADLTSGSGWSAAARMPSHVWPPHEDVPEPVERSSAPGSAVTAVVALRVLSDGDVVAGTDRVVVRGARELVVLLGSETDFGGPGVVPHGDVERLRTVLDARLDAALDRGPAALRAEHVAEHRGFMDRVDLVLDGPRDLAGPAVPRTPRAGVAHLTTDERLARYARGEPDPDLAVLAFQHGRYLLLAGSRPGSLPMGLQGLWNEHVQPPWSGNYTLNINTEMSYWPALGANLAECHEPLLTWLGGLAASGRRTAGELYGARGWAAHHNSDAWGFSLPAGEGDGDPCWTAWPLGGVWLARHVWDHHEYTGDVRLLADRGWPLLRGAAEFALDWLVELPDGTLGTSPATSPENHYVAPDGAPAAVAVSTTSDLAMIRDLLENLLAAHSALREVAGSTGDTGDTGTTGTTAGLPDPAGDTPARSDAGTLDDVDLLDRARAALDRLPAERVGADGRLAEWATDVPDAEPGHRHQSHLYRVHPGTSIDPDQTPGLAAAAVAALDARGPESTGWSLAWRLNLRARLRDVAGAEAALRTFLRPVDADLRPPGTGEHSGGVYRNLFCAHPPFQVDGNLGFTAGVVELLVQGHRHVEVAGERLREVHLLPTLPAVWPSGSVRGLRVRGGFTVAMTWADGALVSAEVVADRAVRVVLRTGDARDVVELAAGEPVHWPPSGRSRT